MSKTYTTNIHVHPSGPLGGYVSPPPSKNYSTRYILAASMAEGTTVVEFPATNDDAKALIQCCKAMGAEIEPIENGLKITGVAGRPQNPGTLNPDNAGAVLRLLLGSAALVEGNVKFETEHTDSLGKRPNEDLLTALRSMGAEINATGSDGRLPITMTAGRSRIRGGEIEVSGANSSQFLSSLLFLTSQLDGESIIRVTGGSSGDPTLVSRPLIDQTCGVLEQFGAQIDRSEDGFKYVVAGRGKLVAPKSGRIRVNADWPSAAALMSTMAVGAGMAELSGLAEDAQGERRAQSALSQMGCNFSPTTPSILNVHSKGDLVAIEFDGDLATDAVLALEAAACLAEGKSRFSGIANLKIKETDRIKVPAEQLRLIGVEVTHGDDWVEIVGRPEGYEGGIEVDCCGDHRIAQMLAIVGIRCSKGLTLLGADCVTKSYPDFFADLRQLGVKLEVR